MRGLLYKGGMDYTDWLIIKFVVLVAAAGVWGFWRGVNGLPLGLGESTEPEDQEARHGTASAGD